MLLTCINNVLFINIRAIFKESIFIEPILLARWIYCPCESF